MPEILLLLVLGQAGEFPGLKTFLRMWKQAKKLEMVLLFPKAFPSKPSKLGEFPGSTVSVHCVLAQGYLEFTKVSSISGLWLLRN